MEKFERAAQAEESRLLIQEGWEDKKQLEEMKTQEDVEGCVQDFYDGMNYARGDSYPDTGRMFRHVQALVDFMSHQPYGDRELNRIVPDLYRRYFTSDYYENSQEYDETYINSYSVRETINNFAELYAMTGIPPSVTGDAHDYLVNPLVICFERITQDVGGYEENFRALNDKYHKGGSLRESDLWVEALGENPDLGKVMQLESVAFDRYLTRGNVEDVFNVEHLKNVYGVSPVLDAKQQEEIEAAGDSMVQGIVRLLNWRHLESEDIDYIIYQQADRLRALGSLAGFEPKFSEYNNEIRKSYDTLLEDSDPYEYFGERIERLEKLAEVTGIPLGFSSQAVQVFYKKALREAMKDSYNLDAKFELLQVFIPLPEFSPEDVKDIWEFVIEKLMEDPGYRAEELKKVILYTSVVLKADPQPFLVKAYKNLLFNMHKLDYAHLGLMKELFGELPVLSEEEQQEIYTAFFIERGINSIWQSSSFAHEMKIFSQETGLSPLLDEQKVQEFYKKLLREKINYVNDFFIWYNYINEVNSNHDVAIDFTSLEQEVQRMYNLPVSASDGTRDLFERIAEITGYNSPQKLDSMIRW